MLNLKPEKVFYYFEEISKIPRGSGNTKAVSDYCVEFAKERGLQVWQDAWNNVIIRKPASAGREQEEGVIIQGHLDMVAEKTPESSHDFMKDPLELMVEGDFLTAKDTTLGADDGIAIAMGLALLDDNEVSHPQLEMIFTTDEETGMDGAMNIDLSNITGKYVLNLDSEDEGILTAGCAGGGKVKTEIPVVRQEEEGLLVNLHVTGLKGGHSGVEIDKERANANLVMARLLKFMKKEMNVKLVQIAGGGKDNAIPRECQAQVLVISEEEAKKLQELTGTFEEMLQGEYVTADPELQVICQCEGVQKAQVLIEESFARVLFYLNNLPNGPMHRNQDIPELVETSLNLGVLVLKEAFLECHTSIRSSVKSRRGWLIDKLADMAEQVEGTTEVSGQYPEWSFKKESKLRDAMLAIYEEMFQEKMVVDVIHAGLECGYLLEKKPELDVVSFGPQMYDIHTTEERISISSVEKIYEFVKRILSTKL